MDESQQLTQKKISVHERLYWLGFSVFPGIGPIKFADLYTQFGTAEAIWKATSSDLQEAGLGEKLLTHFLTFRTSFSLEDYAEKLEKQQVDYVLLGDSMYPSLLKQIKNAPFVLYVKGNQEVLELDTTIAIVGTRKITQYGRDVTQLFTRELVAAGCCIVSGLALGVDAVAHLTTIENNGKTIAVLGCGVDCCTPSTNQHIYNRIIASGGAIVSEFPLGAAPTVGSFPSRNRIIAGISQSILVTEGAEDSGALITAEVGLKNKRTIYAIPGPITSSLSQGPYKLIAQGGKLATRPQDILEDMGVRVSPHKHVIKALKGDTQEEQNIIDLLQRESLHFDEILKRTQKSSAELGALLTMMEIKGLITNVEGIYTL